MPTRRRRCCPRLPFPQVELNSKEEELEQERTAHQATRDEREGIRKKMIARAKINREVEDKEAQAGYVRQGCEVAWMLCPTNSRTRSLAHPVAPYIRVRPRSEPGQSVESALADAQAEIARLQAAVVHPDTDADKELVRLRQEALEREREMAALKEKLAVSQQKLVRGSRVRVLCGVASSDCATTAAAHRSPTSVLTRDASTRLPDESDQGLE